MKIAHVITGLNVGGAEHFLARLIQGLPDRFDCAVFSLSDEGAVGAQLRKAGVPVLALNMRKRPLAPGPILRLSRELKAFDPDIVHTWMYHADLVGGIAARIAGLRPVVWCIRQGHLDPRHQKKSTIFVMHTCARLSRLIPDHIVCCGETAKRNHAQFGYDSARMRVISNGFDTQIFRPNREARYRIRAELGIDEDAVVCAMIGRFAPQKGHDILFAAAVELLKKIPNMVFLLAGYDVAAKNPVIVSWLTDSMFRDRIMLLGPRTDVPSLLAASDIGVSSSHSEGFPNAIGEAMATGLPCIGTDVGDTARLIGSAGIVVPPGDAQALAAAITSVAALSKGERRRLGEMARQRIAAEFEIGEIVNQYRAFYESIASCSNPT